MKVPHSGWDPAGDLRVQKGGAVKAAQAVTVFGEMGRNPVEDHADLVLVALVDKVHEIFRSPVSAGDAERAGHLISPGFIQRVFHHRHEFNMGESQLLDIGDELVGQFPEGEKTFRIFRVTLPGTWMDLIDGQGLIIG